VDDTLPVQVLQPGHQLNKVPVQAISRVITFR
jgi:hypothetical protein